MKKPKQEDRYHVGALTQGQKIAPKVESSRTISV